MYSQDLIWKWKRTEAFLLDARSHLSESAEAVCRSHLSESAEAVCADEIQWFHEYLEHNEFGLALDALEEVFRKSECESLRVLELMALAAASMGLFDQQLRYDEELSKAHGWKYGTVLPS